MKFLKHLFHPVSKSVLVAKSYQPKTGNLELGESERTEYIFRCECCGHTWKQVISGKEISSIKIGE